ncbi:MAG: ribonuclease III [Oscillospiraceae bacterium]|jgi:ribonuclease-3 family protein|nr:ribonuclease III [Oscillospiraceae bacterium]
MPHEINTLGLAYIGDAVYELKCREAAYSAGFSTAETLHRETVKKVNANSQAVLSHKLAELLTDEERAVWTRGRNAKVRAIPKNSSEAEYHYATALETVFGWLFLNGGGERIDELFSILQQGEK